MCAVAKTDGWKGGLRSEKTAVKTREARFQGRIQSPEKGKEGGACFGGLRRLRRRVRQGKESEGTYQSRPLSGFRVANVRQAGERLGRDFERTEKESQESQDQERHEGNHQLYRHIQLQFLPPTVLTLFSTLQRPRHSTSEP